MSATRTGHTPHRSMAVALLVLGASCAPAPSGTTAPGFAALDGTPRATLLAYGSSLSFDTALAAGDEQPLPVRDSTGRIVPGPVVRIEPERGAAYLTRAQLGSGRIIARYRAQAAYPPLGIPVGMSYIWADSIGGKWREVVIPETPSESLRTDSMTLDIHSPAYYGPHPVHAARWIVGSDYVLCNKPCTEYGCCRCTTVMLPALVKSPAPAIK